MIAIKFKYSDILEGREFKSFRIFEPSTLTPLGSVNYEINAPDPTLNELRFKTGITDIYAIIDMRSFENFLNYFRKNRQELMELNTKLSKDPTVLKSIAEYEKDQKQFRIWQAAKKWEV